MELSNDNNFSIAITEEPIEKLDATETRDEQTILLEKEFKDHKWLYFTCFFIIGTLNNTGFVVIGAASQDLAILFHYSNHMALFTGCLLLSGVLTQMANSRWFLQVNHEFKMWIITFGFTLGNLITIGGVCLNKDNREEGHHGWGFIFTLIGSLLLGCSCSLGDCTMLGFMKVFPSMVISGYVSGTGMSGILGGV